MMMKMILGFNPEKLRYEKKLQKKKFVVRKELCLVVTLF